MPSRLTPAGISTPHVESTFRNVHQEQYQYGGIAWQAGAGLEYHLWQFVYAIADARLRYGFAKFWSAEVAVSNLADKRYESVVGYDAPRRSILLSVRFEPTSGMPNAFTGSGEESWHEGPGGFTLIEEEHLPTPGGQGYLLGIFWWDSIAKKLQGMECNRLRW